MNNDHETVRKQIEAGINIGGPPVGGLQVTGGTGTCDPSGAAVIQESLDCAFQSQMLGTGPTFNALSAGQLMNELPFSCMINLINGPYSNCDEDIPEDKRKAAYEAFVNVTGFKPADLTKVVEAQNANLNSYINYNSFYMFMPTLILVLIVVWLMVGFRWIDWVIGLYFTVIAFVILYGFSILYRLHVQGNFTNKGRKLVDEARRAQQNLENSIAYWPQGLFAAACAVTCDGNTGCWTCNSECPPCANKNNVCNNNTFNSGEQVQVRSNENKRRNKRKPHRNQA